MKPYISPEVLAYLNEMYPNRCAVPGSTVERIWLESGNRQVVDHLKVLFDEQVAEALRVTRT